MRFKCNSEICKSQRGWFRLGSTPMGGLLLQVNFDFLSDEF